jgi:alpha-1,2-rhamnosyltransferase
MRFLIECTHTFFNPAHNTGIQRVVRNIVEHLPEATEEVEFRPVVLKEGELYGVKDLPDVDEEPQYSDVPPWPYRVLERVEQRHAGLSRRYQRINERPSFQRSKNARRALFVVVKALDLGLRALKKGLRTIGDRVEDQRLERLELSENDHLILIDASWNYSQAPQAFEAINASGAKIYGAVHDTIPLTNPEFFHGKLVDDFSKWFEAVAQLAAGYICVSRTTMERTRNKVNALVGSQAGERKVYDYFYSGSDFSRQTQRGSVRPQLMDIFASDEPVYLMVGTIEPRKNHRYVLDAFDQLWQQGVRARLLIIGGQGWKCDDLVDRVLQHQHHGQALVMVNDATDAELNHCYQRANRLILASHDEGFGLPIIESMNNNLPVICSDIDIFREVGGQYCDYFDLSDCGSLAAQVKAQLGDTNEVAALEGWRWDNWREATRRFCDNLVDLARRSEASRG